MIATSTKANTQSLDLYKNHIALYFNLEHAERRGGRRVVDFPGPEVEPEELTVVSWVLPQTESTRRSNRRESFYPSESWARARIFGEQFNQKLRKHVVKTLMDNGLETVAPVLLAQWERKTSERFVSLPPGRSGMRPMLADWEPSGCVMG